MLKELSLTNLQRDELDRLKYLTSKVLDSRAPLRRNMVDKIRRHF